MILNSRDNAKGALVMLLDLHHDQNDTASNNISKGSKIVSLAEPGSGEERDYLCSDRSSGNGCDLFEIQSIKGKSTYGSYFVGSRVVSNGALYLSTRVDPVFFALGVLAQKSTNSSKWQPLDQLVVGIPTVVQEALLASCGNNVSQLQHLCETTDQFGDDLILYKFSPERALKWLRKKQECALTVVKQHMLETMSLEREQKLKKEESGGSGAFSSSFRLADDEETNMGSPIAVADLSTSTDSTVLNSIQERQALEASLQVVCEYLSPEWRVKLVESFNMTERVLLSEKEKQASNEGTDGGTKKRKADWEAAPGANEADELLQFTTGGSTGENGNKSEKDKKKPPAQSAGLKRLAKVSTKGMKSLSSFFGGGAKKAKKKSN